MARKLFGTDGVRGRANDAPMTAETALRLGQAAGRHFTNGGHAHRVLIGKDTRRSGYMLETALTAGFLSAHVAVDRTHVAKINLGFEGWQGENRGENETGQHASARENPQEPTSPDRPCLIHSISHDTPAAFLREGAAAKPRRKHVRSMWVTRLQPTRSSNTSSNSSCVPSPYRTRTRNSCESGLGRETHERRSERIECSY